MRVNDWVREYGTPTGPPKAQPYRHPDGFKFVLCGVCGLPMLSPWYGKQWWEGEELINVLNVTCSNCGIRNRMLKGWRNWHDEKEEEA
jgi:hypothetical protein